MSVSNLADLYTTTKQYADEAVEKKAEFNDLRVESVEGDVKLVGRQGIPARLTNWAFGQLVSASVLQPLTSATSPPPLQPPRTSTMVLPKRVENVGERIPGQAASSTRMAIWSRRS